MPARGHSTPVFYLRHVAEIKLQVLGSNTDTLGDSLAMLLLFAVLSQKSSRTTRQQFRVYGKCSKKPAPKFAALSQCLYSYDGESPMCTQKECVFWAPALLSLLSASPESGVPAQQVCFSLCSFPLPLPLLMRAHSLSQK